MKKFVCALCNKEYEAKSVNELLKHYNVVLGVDIDEYDDTDEINVIARCEKCERETTKI